MRRQWVVLAASLALAGCGGGDQPERRAVTVPAGSPLRVAADEYSFAPGAITLEGGGRLAVTLDNRGSLAHDIRFRRRGRDVGGTPPFQGGRRTAHVKLEPGRYEFLCSVGDHAELGMRGTLRVR